MQIKKRKKHKVENVQEGDATMLMHKKCPDKKNLIKKVIFWNEYRDA